MSLRTSASTLVLLTLVCSALAAQDVRTPPAPAPAVNPPISRIAFGSCSTQDEPQGILRTALEWDPELFIYMGDNIYGDTRDMQVLQQRYETLGRHPNFSSCVQRCR